MDRIYIGLIGMGTVGTGLVKILQENGKLLEKRLGMPVILKRIADVDVSRDRGVKVNPALFTPRASDVIEDPEISVVLELIGGLEPARTFILQALQRGKHVITANKALLAVHGSEIFAAADQAGVDIGFEGSVGGGIPIIRSMKEGLVANQIQVIFGILNGTSNYILSEMTQKGLDFKDVLKKAQELGYAEADPTLDVEGIDTAHKLCILLSLAYGVQVKMEDIYTEGVTGITSMDIEYAKDLGYRIKLLAIAKSEGGPIEARVHPTLIPEDHLLATVNGPFNAIFVKGDAVGSTLFYGAGAGMMATGSAVVSDLVEICRNLRLGVSRRVPLLSYQRAHLRDAEIKSIQDISSTYYLRFTVIDRPGVLSRISGILADLDISIESVIQKGRKTDKGVFIYMLTHEARERNMTKALEVIDRLPVIMDKTVLIRIEDPTRLG
ncbi:MAG TPA: homoserine dehydrogenase [Thermodesulfobacteriota bacterium]|nr:homoserine dehydrogenase [Thermodesulfobacteriota bacterium]